MEINVRRSQLRELIATLTQLEADIAEDDHLTDVVIRENGYDLRFSIDVLKATVETVGDEDREVTTLIRRIEIPSPAYAILMNE